MKHSPDRGHAWDRYSWHLYAVAAACLTVTTAVASATVDRDVQRVWVLVGAVGFATWQIVWHRAYGRDQATAMQHLLWGVGTIVLWVFLAVLAPAFYVLLFAVFPLLFLRCPIRVASALAILLSLAIAGLNLGDVSDPGDVVLTAILATLTAGTSIVIGHWIDKIIQQSHERSALIDELELTRADLAEAARVRGAMVERERWAGEIHDTLAQGFTSIVVLLEAVSVDLGASIPDAASHRLGLATSTARANLAEARNLVANLIPQPLTDDSPWGAISRVCDDLAAATGTQTRMDVRGVPGVVPIDCEVALLRVAQEAMANVRRHAAATRVDVCLDYSESGCVSLVVADDGAGFEVSSVSAGFGLAGMVGRLRSLGGEIEIDSLSDQGTRIVATLPIGPASHHAPGHQTCQAAS